MRIITGTAKGRKVKAPPGMNTRPTLDRVKESLYNIIAPRIYGANVFDVFAGSGNLGLEALSRGAKLCVFTEQNKDSYKYLVENINTLNFENRCEHYNNDCLSVMRTLKARDIKFDVIILDPPYFKGLIAKALDEIDKDGLLSEDGIITSEYDETEIIPERVGNIKQFRTVKYGRTKISFWTKETKE